jgi:branched-chain amino acid transport system substrate-binding protein
VLNKAIAMKSRIPHYVVLFSATFLLAGCVASSRMGGAIMTPEASLPEEQTQPASAPEASQPITGTELAAPGTTAPDAVSAATAAPPPPGSIRVALLLPLSAQGTTGSVAQSLKNAADMAMSEFSGAKLDLVVKDERGTPDGAREAAKQAIAEGSSAVIGPLLASSVQVAGSVVRASGKPMIAFSTDAGVAGRGVYLLSFMPQSDVERILDYAVSNGKKSLGALIPDTPYGSAVNAVLQDGAAKRGIRLLAIERYSGSSIDAAAKRLASIKDQMDCLFLPENGEGAAAAGKALQSAGIDTKKIQLLGTSAWDDPRVFATPQFAGGWFAMPDKAGYEAFAERYRTKFGNDPVRIATLAYDAVFLANALQKKAGDHAFDENQITATDGVIGTDGLFRFRTDGTTQRSEVVMQIGKDGPTKLDGAPTTFR